MPALKTKKFHNIYECKKLFRPRIRADDWTLVISATEARDAGTYECSVNTLPKISHTVALAVKEMAMAVINFSPRLSLIVLLRTLLTKSREF